MEKVLRNSRREFLKTSTALAAAASMPYWFTAQSAFALEKQRPTLGCIGTGDRWKAVGPSAMKFADCVAVCDVDSAHLDEAYDIVKRIQPGDRAVAKSEDYQAILDDPKIDLVTIVTPDHWHSKIAIEAMRAGKDVYCEKPMTLTIDEGKRICQVAKETGRIFQVGTQQRSGMGQRFLKAIALAREGRLGTIQKIECVINGVGGSGPIPVAEPPKTLNWEKWLGQAPLVDFRFKGDDSRWGKSRCHFEFRWWYEYSGGKMTDWGAHHVDIAQWLIDQTGEGQGPILVTPTMAEHLAELDGHGNPTQDDRYNVANKFLVSCEFPNNVVVEIHSEGRNGLLITGSEGRIFVGRGALEGKPVEDLAKNPLPEDAIAKVYGGKNPRPEGNGMNDTDVHMHNFIDCVVSREKPIADVFTHHRSLTTCHLANIAVRLGRPIRWDPKTEEIVDDPEAQAMQTREQRKGYEIPA